MDTPQYVRLFQKIMLKFATTFKQIEALCQQTLVHTMPPNINQSSFEQPIQNGIQIDNNEAAEFEQIDSPSPSPPREVKSKKIRKDVYSTTTTGLIQVTRKKPKKISHKPKAPASSFLLFFKDHQAQIAKSYPNYGVTELTKVAAKCWNQLNAQEKQPYVKLCDEQRRIYREKMDKYRQEFPQEIAEKEKDRKLMRKQKKAKDTPKKEKQHDKPTIAELKESLPEPLLEEVSISSSESIHMEDSLGAV